MEGAGCNAEVGAAWAATEEKWKAIAGTNAGRGEVASAAAAPVARVEAAAAPATASKILDALGKEQSNSDLPSYRNMFKEVLKHPDGKELMRDALARNSNGNREARLQKLNTLLTDLKDICPEAFTEADRASIMETCATEVDECAQLMSEMEEVVAAPAVGEAAAAPAVEAAAAPATVPSARIENKIDTGHWAEPFKGDVEKYGLDYALTKLRELPTSGLLAMLKYHTNHDIIPETHEDNLRLAKSVAALKREFARRTTRKSQPEAAPAVGQF